MSVDRSEEFDATFIIANSVEEYRVIRLCMDKHYNAPKMMVDNNQPCVDIARIVCTYLSGRVICKCTLEQKMTAYQVGNCLTTVITEVVNVPRIMISLLWRPEIYREMEVMVVISLLSTWVDDILNYDVLRDPGAVS